MQQALLLSPFGAMAAQDWETEKDQIERDMIKAFGKGGVDELDKALAKHGFKLLGREKVVVPGEPSSGDVSINSSGSQVTLYYDYWFSISQGKYMVRGSWEWTDKNYDLSSAPPDDAFGLWLSKLDGTPATGQVFDSEGIAVYDSAGNYYQDAAWCADWDLANAGVAWQINDGFNPWNFYVGDRGQGWIWMTRPPSGTVYLKSKLVHTWITGGILTIGINAQGLYVTLEAGTASWPKAGQTTIYDWPVYE